MKRTIILLLVSLLVAITHLANAHPGSGIAVDRQGNVYFVDTGSGVWKIEPNGALTKIQGPAYHWMTIDHDGQLQGATLPHFSQGDATVTRAGTNPTLLLSSDFPISVGPNGVLYYPWRTDAQALQLFRQFPSGTTGVLKTLPAATESGALHWLNGLATGPDGSIYYTENRAVRKISQGKTLTTVVENVMLPGCDSVPGVGPDLGPYFRGLDVDAQGNIFVAATGCRAVFKIATDKSIATVLRTSNPWSPTGVAISGNDVYVLEYLHTPGDNRSEWLPRVRKLTSDGRVITLATIDRRSGTQAE